MGGCLPHSQDIRVPPGPTGIPINNLSFSDDRRLISPTLSDLVTLTRLCTAATVAKGGLVHPKKLQFYALTAPDGVLRQEEVPVPFYGVLTSTTSPQVVGIPLTADLTAPPALDALARDVMRLRTRQQSVRVTPVLALRALWAYVLAKFDYIASGVAVNPVHIHPLAIQVRALYRQTLALPCWTSRALMALPMAGGGPGSPNLELRAAAHLLATYTQASCSGSPMARAAAAYLASTDCPGGERPHLSRAAAALNVQLAVLPDPQTTELAVHIHGDLRSLQGHSRLIISTDGALRGQSAGGGVVLATAAGTLVA